AASAPAALAATPKADAAPKDPSAPILRDVAEGKVAVVLFFSDVASDDRAVRRALLAADRHAGKVVVRVAPIARVADYAAITEGVDVTQAPTLLVIGRQNRARRIVGFTDTKGIDQLVSDVGGANFAARRFKGYRGKVENLCAVVGQSVVGNALDGQDLTDRLEIVRADLLDARRAVRRLDPPKRFAAFQSRFEDNLDVGVDAFDAALAAQRAGEDPVATYAGFMDRIAATDRKVRAAAKKAGIGSGC
ncbi:MAG: hypothetical protein JWO90_2311, partial [Solirubrobacterales bacterium]|nr:hypothetical protein [Solirubrobacterales bacterium]